jgi:hypothetical protein
VTLNAALAAAATLVACAFAISTGDRWLQRRRPHDGAWTVSLVFFAVGSAALWWAQARGWSLASFRVFFLMGAILNVPWLALGSVYLLFGRRIGDVTRAWLIGLSGAASGVVLIAPTKGAIISADELPKGSDLFGVAPRVFAAVGSGVAALVIFAGALWSLWRVLRRRQPAATGHQRQILDPRRNAGGNALIALGTIVLSLSGSLAGRLGESRAFIVTLLVGVVFLFAGFLVASTRPSQSPTQQLARDIAR